VASENFAIQWKARHHRPQIWQFVTGVDAATAAAALLLALEAIYAGAFSRAAPLLEKFWRHNGHSENGTG
jgi:hypothetical protein